jgi:hypothetical protein
MEHIFSYKANLRNPPENIGPTPEGLRMITSHPDYLWLNRLQCVNIGVGDLENWFAAYDVYALR